MLRARRGILRMSQVQSVKPSKGNLKSCASAHSGHILLLPCTGPYVAVFLALEALL